MKIIKRLTTILFTIMMVLMTTTIVFADEPADTAEGASSTNKGTITITNPINEEYKVYKIFDLESYSGTNYSYKVVDKWANFFARTGGGYGYITLDDDGYIKSFNLTERNAPGFARNALRYAQDVSNGVSAITSTPTINNNPDGTQTITYSDVDMGYYLVDSSVGALCSLNTTNLTATITEKNSVPTVQKKVGYSGGSFYAANNSAKIGQVLSFQTIINVGDGAQNYILHDKMDAGLTYKDSSLKVYIKKTTDGDFSLLDSTKYTLKIPATDGDTFDIEFQPYFLDGLKKGDKIKIEYEATLNENAVIGSTGNKNKAWLSYGDNKTTTERQTITRTFGIPVFKFYKTDVAGITSEQPLANVKFKLSSNADADINNDNDFIKFVKDTTTDVYRKALDTETASSTELVSNNSGNIILQGLAGETYYLYETETVKGYNKLTKPVQIRIKPDGKIEYANKGETLQAVGADGLVKVENKTGTVLPSTGGVGTTMMYVVGAMLLIGSGVLLITKKNMK